MAVRSSINPKCRSSKDRETRSDRVSWVSGTGSSFYPETPPPDDYMTSLIAKVACHLIHAAVAGAVAIRLFSRQIPLTQVYVSRGVEPPVP